MQRHIQRHNFWALGRAKRSNIIKFQLLSRFQIFFRPNCVCLLKNETYIYKTYQTVFLFRRQGHAPGVGLWRTGGMGSKKIPKLNQRGGLICAHAWIFI